MKGFKKTGNGPRYGGHSFSSSAGFSGSTGKVRNVRGYTQAVTSKKKFASGGAVVAPNMDSSVTSRTQPVTQADAEHGGTSPLRPGFNKGGKACYALGGVARPFRNAGPIKSPVAAPAVGMAAPARFTSGRPGYGSFSGRPIVGRK